jgi:hypothetical protein
LKCLEIPIACYACYTKLECEEKRNKPLGAYYFMLNVVEINRCVNLKADLKLLKVVTSEKIGGSGVTSTLGTWYGGVVMGVLLSFNEAAILYRDFNSAPSQKQNIIVFAANNSRCCEYHVAPTIIL